VKGSGRERVLVIKLAALGDVVQAFWAFDRIRRAHPEAEITLLTTPPYRDLAAASGLFDRIETDGRPKGARATLSLFSRLRRAGYARVYDLQTSGRSKQYIWAFWPRAPEWSGISPGASHRQTRPDRDSLHNLDRIADQLHVAGIAPAFPIGEAPAPDLGWAVEAARVDGRTPAERFALPRPYALLAAGASPSRPQKRWPMERYAELATALQARGITPVAVGGPDERPLAEAIRAREPAAIDLTGRTSMVDLAGLGAEARLAVGNDTGPTHMVAYAGAPGLMLMSPITRAGHCEPRAAMDSLMAPDLAALPSEAVIERLVRAGLIPP
jgi:ADP-heptose:LPS heptosyltransferase